MPTHPDSVTKGVNTMNPDFSPFVSVWDEPGGGDRGPEAGNTPATASSRHAPRSATRATTVALRTNKYLVFVQVVATEPDTPHVQRQRVEADVTNHVTCRRAGRGTHSSANQTRRARSTRSPLATTHVSSTSTGGAFSLACTASMSSTFQ